MQYFEKGVAEKANLSRNSVADGLLCGTFSVNEWTIQGVWNLSVVRKDTVWFILLSIMAPCKVSDFGSISTCLHPRTGCFSNQWFLQNILNWIVLRFWVLVCNLMIFTFRIGSLRTSDINHSWDSTTSSKVF